LTRKREALANRAPKARLWHRELPKRENTTFGLLLMSPAGWEDH